ncbi:MAG: hypothetical protein AAF362_04340 [Pseudomonadota bacterium]
MKIRSTPTTVVIVAIGLAVSSCQTSDTSGPSTAVVPVDAQPTAPAVNPNCITELAKGPPSKPARGADFGQAAAKDNADGGQGLIQTIGGHFGGQTAAATDSANSAEVSSNEDVKGTWNITDGSPSCVCKLAMDGVFATQGRGSDTGTVKLNECTSPGITNMAAWSIAYTANGYDSKLELQTKDRKTVLATLNRDGVHYFSGTLSNGTPITMWRDGQNYNQLQFGQSQTQPVQ